MIYIFLQCVTFQLRLVLPTIHLKSGFLFSSSPAMFSHLPMFVHLFSAMTSTRSPCGGIASVTGIHLVASSNPF